MYMDIFNTIVLRFLHTGNIFLIPSSSILLVFNLIALIAREQIYSMLRRKRGDPLFDEVRVAQSDQISSSSSSLLSIMLAISR